MLEGTTQLTNQNGGWRVTALDPALLGFDLGALGTVGTLCADLQAANYGAVYGLLAPTATGGAQTVADFTQAAQLRSQLDGSVGACAVVGIASGASATAGTVTLSVTHTKLGVRQGQVGLAEQNGGWTIVLLDGQLLGTDVGPIIVGERFCTDLAGTNYADAYSLLSAAEQAVGTEAVFAKAFALPAPLKWGPCTPDLTTYKVDTQQASYTMTFTLVDPTTGGSASVKFALSFVLENQAWKLDNLGKA